MIQTLSRSVLKAHDENVAMIDSWFIDIVGNVVRNHTPDERDPLSKNAAHFLYRVAGNAFSKISVNGFDPTDAMYLKLREFNFTQGVPILACCVVIHIAQLLPKMTNFGILITRETPLISKHQIWVETTGKDGVKQLIWDQFSTQFTSMPPDIAKFEHIIVPEF